MAQKCSICNSTNRLKINKALIHGESLRAVAGQFHVTRSSLQRHKASCLKAQLQRAAERQSLDSDYLLDELLLLQKAAKALFIKAQNADAFSGAASALREARASLEVIGRIVGAIGGDGPTVNVLAVSGEWPQLRDRILGALEAFPDARAAVVAALGSGETGDVVEGESVEVLPLEDQSRAALTIQRGQESKDA